MRKRPWIAGGVIVLIGAAAAAAFVALGLYDVAANTPHSQPVYSLLDTTKQQSVRRQARHIDAPHTAMPISASASATRSTSPLASVRCVERR